jgi:hypothetical protein
MSARIPRTQWFPWPPTRPDDSSILNIDNTKRDMLTLNMLAGDKWPSKAIVEGIRTDE